MHSRLMNAVARFRDHLRYNGMELDWLNAREIILFDTLGGIGDGRIKHWARVTLTSERLVVKHPMYGPNFRELDETGFEVPVDRLRLVGSRRVGFQLFGNGLGEEVTVTDLHGTEHSFWLPDATELCGWIRSVTR